MVFLDTSNEFKFISRSTITTADTITMEDGNTYPLVKLEVTSMSHPFYTGKKMFLDTAGRVEKFNRRFKKKAEVEEETTEATAEDKTEA